MAKDIIILCEPGTLVSDGLVPEAVKLIDEHEKLNLEFLADVSNNKETHSYYQNVLKRIHPKRIGHAMLRSMHNRPYLSFPNCRSWATAPHTPQTAVVDISDPNEEDFCQKVKDTKPAAVLLLGCSHILNERLISIPSLGIINFHWSYLPEYRGRYVTYWASYNGETQHGVTYHTITPEIDQGNVIVQTRVPIRAGSPTLSNDCLSAGRQLLPKIMKRIAISDLRETNEIQNGDYYAAKDFEEHNMGFDETESPFENKRRLRAAEELPINVGGKKGLLTGLEVIDQQTTEDHGLILDVDRDGISVAMGGQVGRLTSFYYLPAWPVARCLSISPGDFIYGI